MTEVFVFKFYIFTWFKWSLFFGAVLGAQQYSQVALPPAPSTSPTRESTLTRRPRPRSVVYVGSHPRRCTVYECGPMYDDTYPPLHPEDFKCRVGGSCAREWGRGEETPRPLLGQPHLQDMDRTRPLGLTGRAHRQLQAGEAADNWHLPARGRSSATTPPGSGGDLRACAPRATLSNQGRVSP